MKLSNKILVAFFGCLFLYLTAVFAEIRLRGTPNIIDDANSIAESVDLSGFNHIALKSLEENDVNVTGSDRTRLELRSLSGDLLPRLTYSISGDTLELSGMELNGTTPVKITVYVPQSGLKGMIVNGASATVKNLNQGLLHISQNAGQIRIANSRIGMLHVVASHGSQLSINETDLDTLSATIDESQVLLSSPLRVLKGSMKNNAFFHVQDLDEIEFKKDESSRFNVYRQ